MPALEGTVIGKRVQKYMFELDGMCRSAYRAKFHSHVVGEDLFEQYLKSAKKDIYGYDNVKGRMSMCHEMMPIPFVVTYILSGDTIYLWSLRTIFYDMYKSLSRDIHAHKAPSFRLYNDEEWKVVKQGYKELSDEIKAEYSKVQSLENHASNAFTLDDLENQWQYIIKFHKEKGNSFIGDDVMPKLYESYEHLQDKLSSIRPKKTDGEEDISPF